MKKLIALILCCLPLVCYGINLKGRKISFRRGGKSWVTTLSSRLQTANMERHTYAQNIRTYILRGMNNVSKKTNSGKRLFYGKEHVPVVLEQLKKDPGASEQLAKKARVSTAALHENPYMPLEHFWEMVWEDYQTNGKEFVEPVESVGNGILISTLQDFYLKDHQGKHYMIPAGATLPMGGKITPTGKWRWPTENELQVLKRTAPDYSRIELTREHTFVDFSGTDIYLTKADLEKLLLSEHASEFFGSPILIKDVTGVKVAIPVKVEMAIETPLATEEIKPLDYVTIVMDDMPTLGTKESADRPIPYHTAQIKEIKNISGHAFTAKEAAAYAHESKSSLFYAKDGVYIPRQRMLFQNREGVLYVISPKSRLIETVNGLELSPVGEAEKYADFKNAVLENVLQPEHVNWEELPKDYPTQPLKPDTPLHP